MSRLGFVRVRRAIDESSLLTEPIRPGKLPLVGSKNARPRLQL